MKKISIPIVILMAATLSACGSDFEWFPKTADTTAPTVRGSIGTLSFSNNTTIYPSLPNTASLLGTDTASEPVTIYYTTNNTDPTIAANTYTSSFTIENNSWTLRFFGKDTAGNSSAPLTVKFQK
jgi:hypothetical protein